MCFAEHSVGNNQIVEAIRITAASAEPLTTIDAAAAVAAVAVTAAAAVVPSVN